MDKEKTKVIIEQRRKEREETNKMCVADSHSVLYRIVQRLVEKKYKAYLNQAWSIIAIRKVGENFHHNL